ncbi:MAG: hypothetical protein HDS01_02325 [Bacteroides sp.]|nr:hypothetical protein [Bacteroides sp.]
MRKHFITMALAALTLMPAVAGSRQSDPVVMTVNGKDVRQSEFQYLYNKNNLQQVAPQTIDEYVDMFVTYKLKVADAEAAGIDTTAAFRNEFNGYCMELTAPYLRDKKVEDRLVDEAYARMKVSRCVSHILVPLGMTRAERKANREKLDSIRAAIVAGADFGEMAMRYSVDRSALQNRGNLGFINANSFPYPFEKVAFDTPVGAISEVFEDAPYGYHIIMVTAERPASGEVSARHILKLTQGMSPEEAAIQKSRIDSIAGLLKNGADFEALARAESEDPGSAARGGNLGFFGRGRMVPEFEEAAFSLNPGEISEPFATAYGYHIVQTLEVKPIPSLEECRKEILAVFNRDIRAKLPQKEYLSSLRESSGVSVDSKVLDEVYAHIDSSSDSDQAFEALKVDQTVLAHFPTGDVKVSDVASGISLRPGMDLALAFEDALDEALDNATVDFARQNLMANNADYRNLVNEYRDGILLFEISNRKVWDRSSTDAQAQLDYFRNHRADYAWEAPRFKGYVVFATSDSLASEVKGFLASKSVSADALAGEMSENFGRDVKVERVLTAKGENNIIDQIAFGGTQAEPVGRWIAWFPYAYKVIDAPEEPADVKGALASDLQQHLEAEWIKDLHNRYKVKVNNKAIKKIASN